MEISCTVLTLLHFVSVFGVNELSGQTCEDTNCTSVLITNSAVSCLMVYTHPSTNDPERSTPGKEETEIRNGPSKTVHGATKTILCKKADKGPEKKDPQCFRILSKPSDSADGDDGDKDCVLHRQKNITSELRIIFVKFPIKLMPGMKMRLYTGRQEGQKESVFTISKKPRNPLSFSMQQVKINWNEKTVKGYSGVFPISNSANFTFTTELTETVTKMYLDGVEVASIKAIPFIEDINLTWCSKVHEAVILKGSCA